MVNRGLLDPKVDFVFKNIFGSPKHPKILIPFNFHTGYRFKEITTNEELTDVMEIHFIESPKLNNNSDEKDMLVAWTEFLKNPESEKVRGLELSIEEIRQAKDELIRMSNNPEERALYDMRAKILKDKISELNSAKEEGREEGINLTKKVFKLASKGESISSIARICEISEDEIKNILE